jgi:predicted transcriptional regulator YdeE
LNRREPSLVELGRARYVGFGQRFISALADDSDNMEVIPELWSRLRSRREEITTSVGSEEYGVTCLLPPSERDRSDELLYLAGRRVHGFSPLPSGMEARETLGGLYAVFEHPGTQATIPQTIAHALLSWLPNSGLDFGHGAEIERVEAGGDRVEFWLPVQERSAG